MSKLKVFGIVFGDKQTEFEPYFNESKEKAWRFENQPMIDIVQNCIDDLDDDDYLGIVSWKFTQKTGLTKDKLLEFYRYHEIRRPQAQIMNFAPDLKLPSKWTFMSWSEEGHVGIRYLIRRCCEHCGMTYNDNPPVVVYANQFLARKKVYKHYVESVIIPSLELLEGALWELTNLPSGYTAGIDLVKLKAGTGLAFYNFVPFVLERMLMQYIDNYGINVVRVI